MKKLIVLLFFSPLFAFAQSKPIISSISPTHVEVGQTITISGSNLNTANRVFFGGVSVTPTVISSNTLRATVPAGATNGTIVIQTSGDLSSESAQHFFISHGGSGTSSFKDEFIFESLTATDAYDICLCDLNNDDLNDVIFTHNASGTEATILQNTSTADAPSFTNIGLGNNPENTSGFISTTCGDLDNDGNSDVIFTTNDGTNITHVFIYENTSAGAVSLSFVNGLNLLLPDDSGGDNRVPRRLKTSDVDGDGKLDLIVGNENDNTIHIFPNTSSGDGSFTFGSVIEISVGSATSTGAIDIADLDNDGKQDIIIVPAAKSNEVIYILRNQSLPYNNDPTNISFSLQATVGSADQRRNLVIADFNNDGLNDFATTADRTISSISGVESVNIFQNTTTGSTITFSSAETITIPSNIPWGLDAGDLNGDGLIDLGVACIGGNIYGITNQSSGGVDFDEGSLITLSTIANDGPGSSPNASNARNVFIGDLDGDARPDLAYSQNVSLSEQGNLGIRLNKTCIEPVISPDNLEFCFDDTFTLSATKSQQATYLWEFTTSTNGGSSITPIGDNSQADIIVTTGSTTPVGIRVTITHDSGDSYECALSSTETFGLINGAQPGPPTISGPAGVVCFGDPFTLTTGAFDDYEWTKPDGSKVFADEIQITSATLADAGEYTLRTRTTGGCFSEESTAFEVEVSQPPLLEIVNGNLDDFCEGTSMTLEVADLSPDFQYQWYETTAGLLGGETGATLTTTSEGDYRVDIINASDLCVTESAFYAINSVTSPTSVANGATEACAGFLTSFTSASTGEGSFTLQYEWVVNDGLTDIHTATTQDLDFTFPSSGSYTITLTTAYPETEVYAGGPGILCEDSDVISVTVSDPPSVTFDIANETRKCPSDTITITPTLSSGTVTSITWVLRDAFDNTLVENSAITVSSLSPFDGYTPQGVDSVYVVASITNDIGCVVRDSVSLKNFDNSNLAIAEGEASLSDTTINGATYPLIELTNEIFVELNASGGSNYAWTSGGISDNFDSPDEATTTFFPSQPLSLVTLSGIDGNNCDESFTIAVYLDNFRPRKTFSPNGDGRNDCWEILNIGQLGNDAGCKVYVFDSRGRTITTKESFDGSDNCVWDGNFNNSPVPEGVYYFVMKCESSNVSKSGSILLAR